MSPKLNWLRWVIILPAIVLAFFLIYGVANILFTYSGRDENGSYSLVSLIAPLIASAIAGYSSVSIAMYIAPGYKKPSGKIVVALLFCLIGCNIYLLIKDFQSRTLLETIGILIGTVFAYLQKIEEVITD